jgi:integrase
MATTTQLPSGKFRTQIRRKNLAALSKIFDTREEGAAWGVSREAELLAAKNGAVARPNASLTFSSTCERYFLSPKFTEKAPGTQMRERASSKRLLEYFGNYALSVIDGALMQEFIDMRCNERVRHKNGTKLDKKVSADTVRLEKALMSAVFKFAKRRNFISANIMRDSFELPTCIPKEGRITLEQQSALYESAAQMGHARGANPCLLPWVYFVFETGTRPGEAAKIELSWVNLKERKISIPRIGQKKRNARVVLIANDIVKMLEVCETRAREAGSKFLFFSRANAERAKDARGKPIRRLRNETEMSARKCICFAYYSAWRNLCKVAGIPSKINPHIIRHEFISRLFEETDMNDSQIASLVGDLNVLSLEPYKHLRVERLRDRQDAHLDEMRGAMKVLQDLQAKNREAFFDRARVSRAEVQKEREAASDHSTPLDRIRAGVLADVAEQKAADKE